MGESIMAKDKLLTKYDSDTVAKDDDAVDMFEHRDEVVQVMDEMLFHAATGFDQLLHRVDQDEEMPPAGDADDANMEM
ncbi:hypothetical protein N9N97_00395 [Rickettsiaceae bacterium]|nr:hypothetical protein [Rickettsiaceae bacterium]